MKTLDALGILLSCPEFRDLHTHLTDRDNVLSIFRIDNRELRHAALIAWLLSPTAGHGFGAEALREFVVRTAQAHDQQGTNLRQWNLLDLHRLRLDDADIRWELPLPDVAGRADIVVYSSGGGQRRPLLLVELKVDAGQHGGQLAEYVTWADSLVRTSSSRAPILLYLAPGSPDRRVPSEFTTATYNDLLIPWLERLLTLGGTERARMLVGDYLACLSRRSDVVDSAGDALVDALRAVPGAVADALQVLERDKSWGAGQPDLVEEYEVALRRLNLVGRVGTYGESAFVTEVRERMRGKLGGHWRIQGGSASLRVPLSRSAGDGKVPAGVTIQLWLAGPENESASMSLEVVGRRCEERRELAAVLRQRLENDGGLPDGAAIGRGETKVARLTVETPGITDREADVSAVVGHLEPTIHRLVDFAATASTVVDRWLADRQHPTRAGSATS